MKRANRHIGLFLAPFLIALSCASWSAGDARADDRPATGDETGHSALARPLTLTLESDRPGARLATFEFLGSGPRQGFYRAEPVCTAPCSASVLPGFPYRVVGPGMTPSSVFELQPDHDVALHVRGGSWGTNAAGTLLSILGAVYLPVGGGLVGAQEAFGDSKTQALVPVGVTFLTLGAVLLAVGLPLWFESRTHVAIEASDSRAP